MGPLAQLFQKDDVLEIIVTLLPHGASYSLSLPYLQTAWNQRHSDFTGFLFPFFMF